MSLSSTQTDRQVTTATLSMLHNMQACTHSNTQDHNSAEKQPLLLICPTTPHPPPHTHNSPTTPTAGRSVQAHSTGCGLILGFGRSSASAQQCASAAYTKGRRGATSLSPRASAVTSCMKGNPLLVPTAPALYAIGLSSARMSMAASVAEPLLPPLLVDKPSPAELHLAMRRCSLRSLFALVKADAK